jgi:hypothetical protein
MRSTREERQPVTRNDDDDNNSNNNNNNNRPERWVSPLAQEEKYQGKENR